MRLHSAASSIPVFYSDGVRQTHRDEVTLAIASWLLIGGVLGALILVLADLVR